MDPLALIGFGLMALGMLGPAGSARAREASLRAGLQAVQTGLQFQLGQKELALQEQIQKEKLRLQEKALGLEERGLELREKALQFEIARAKAMYRAVIEAGKASLGQETVDRLIQNLEEELKKLEMELGIETQTEPQLNPQTLRPIPEPKLQPFKSQTPPVSYEDFKEFLSNMSSFVYNSTVAFLSAFSPPLSFMLKEGKRRYFDGSSKD